MRGFIREIKRRNVSKVALVYIIAGWLTMQVVDVMFPALNLPEWLISAVAAFLLIGFPFALIFAWAFEMTPEGLKREKDIDRSESITPETGQRLNRTALIILAIAVGFLLFDKFVLHREHLTVDEPVAAVEAKPSIAVLPFVNMSDDPNNEYFSDGLSEELLNLLAKIPQLHVAGRTSSFKFKGTNEDLRIIGEALNVKHVLEGSVRKSGDRLRITAQLVDTRNGFHLWSENYDRTLTDIFAIQDEIAGHVVDSLKVRLLGADVAVANRDTSSVEAYNEFLRGLYFLDRTSEENLARAVASFEEAIRLDPGFARAYAVLSIAQQQTFSGWASSSGTYDGGFVENFELMRGNVDKALELDPDGESSLIAKTMIAVVAEWDIPTSLEAGEKLARMYPNHPNAIGWHATGLFFSRQFAEAEELLLRAVEIDPLSIANWRSLGDVYMGMGRCEDAIATYQRALNLAPGTGRFNGRIARCKLFQGDLAAAKAYNALEPVEWVRETNDLIIDGRTDKGPEWQARIAAYETKYGYGNSYQLAEIYADAGELDKTFEWLVHTARVRDPGGPWAMVMPFFEEAWEDPRWDAYLAEFNL